MKRLRSTRKRSTVFLVIFLLATIGSASAQYQAGDTVTDFVLNDINGNPISLYNYRGKVIVLNFFTTW